MMNQGTNTHTPKIPAIVETAEHADVVRSIGCYVTIKGKDLSDTSHHAILEKCKQLNGTRQRLSLCQKEANAVITKLKRRKGVFTVVAFIFTTVHMLKPSAREKLPIAGAVYAFVASENHARQIRK